MFRDLLENSEQIRKLQEGEIKSLLHNLEAASRETSRLSTELKDAVQALNDEERRGDEWKEVARKQQEETIQEQERGDAWERRAIKMWKWATTSSYKISPSKRELAVTDLLRRHPEAAEWFGEE